MINLEIKLTGDWTKVAGWEASGHKAVELTVHKFEELLKLKVLENLNGKILQKVSGELIGSVHSSVEGNENTLTASVFIEPETPKAWALERGGKGDYTITPKGRILAFLIEGKQVFARSVLHPPMKEYAYLREALREVGPEVSTIWTESFTEAFR